jgi:DNA-binding response OmpR family regulator
MKIRVIEDDGDNGLARAIDERCDAIVVDRMAPSRDGSIVVEAMRPMARGLGAR